MSKILAVDDDPGILRLLEYTLSHEGYQVITASNGMEALRMAQEDIPDLVVLDVMLPGLDGFEVCHRLRSGTRTAHIPVMMLSAKGQEIDKDTGLRLGANEYLVKPVDRAQLLSTVSRLLTERVGTRRTQAKVIAFIGARGGVGTSTVVTSLSVVLAQRQHPPILMDLCPSFGALPSLMGLKPQQTMVQLFKTPTGGFDRGNLEAALARHPSGVRLLSGEETPEEYGKVTAAGIETLLEELGAMTEYILIDMPASPSEVVAAALKKCNFVSLVTGAGHESLSRIGSAVLLLSKLGVDQSRLGVVIVDRTGSGVNSELSNSTSIDGLPVIGIIPFDAEECADAEERGIPVVLAAPLSPAAIGSSSLADRILGLRQLAPSGGGTGGSG